MTARRWATPAAPADALDPSVAAEAAREFLPAGEFEFPQPVFDDPVRRDVLALYAQAIASAEALACDALLLRVLARAAGGPRRRRAIRALGHPSRPRPHR